MKDPKHLWGMGKSLTNNSHRGQGPHQTKAWYGKSQTDKSTKMFIIFIYFCIYYNRLS